jgi:hypothetical protein
MNNQILINLQNKLEEFSEIHGIINVETQRTMLKEELQFYVLNFIYHHPIYSNWTMYGGSALRICHNLDRMSVDLDFEVAHPVTEVFLYKLQEELLKHFSTTYYVDNELLTIKKVGLRGLRLNFHIGDKLGINHPSKQVHVKIDLNYFLALKTTTKRIPINRNQLSFVIKVYNMSTLMASKIAAIMLREQHIVGKMKYQEKGRDIYDLLWYMDKRTVPDIDYLKVKKVDVTDMKNLFNTLTIKILNNEKTDANLRQDLTPLFVNQYYIKNWLKNWRVSYLYLLESYKILKVSSLKVIYVSENFDTENITFIFQYDTEEMESVTISYTISDYWIFDDLPLSIDSTIENVIHIDRASINNKQATDDKLKRLSALFYNKTENYLNKTNRIILGNTITTKLIRKTADNANLKEQIILDKSSLLSCELNDLLK